MRKEFFYLQRPIQEFWYRMPLVFLMGFLFEYAKNAHSERIPR